MPRWFAPQAEIARGPHQLFTKQVAPHTIDEHPRGEWVFGVHDRLGQREPAALLAYPRGEASEEARETALDDGPPVVGRAADEHAHILRRVLVHQPQRVGVVLLLARAG